MNNVGIVLPTYNAANSIIDTIVRIKKYAGSAAIVVVDDSSPDGTAAIVSKYYKNDRTIKVIIREGKLGRGSAVIEGFKKLLVKKNIKYFIEMDADLCHDPKYVPQLVNACHKVDVVIASRYLPGSTIAGWNAKRTVISLLMNFAAKSILRVPITDYSNGYRCYNRKAIEIICTSKVQSRGFIVLSELAYICYKRGLRFSEIPFAFNYIAVSKSNLNFKEMQEAIRTLLMIRYKK